jgi:hypothetical protein
MGKPGRPSPGLDEYLYWQKRLADREASGLSTTDFCAAEDISKSTLYRWHERLKDGIPKALIDGEVDRVALEKADAHFLPVSITSSPIEIELPNGGLVRLPLGVGQAVIVEVIKAITGLQSKRKPTS